ncbi:MAG: hypothetical protein P0Y66_03090 [Candidatus Kaistia colombiensis]|nr:MAG: hypothetical protein P0Y66_03090 [Kaistia sp.]
MARPSRRAAAIRSCLDRLHHRMNDRLERGEAVGIRRQQRRDSLPRSTAPS